MLSIGTLAFLNPWVLAGLIALPILWWLLRAIPPSPRVQTFPGVRLLLGLEDDERQTDKTPWWLLLLRCLAVAAALIGFAQPVANLTERLTGSSGPLLVLMDQGWASAPDWTARLSTARAVLEEADDAGRQVILWAAAERETPPVVSAKEALTRLGSLAPRPWEPDHAAIAEALDADDLGIAETVWLQDGLAREGTDALLDAVADLGPLRLITAEQQPRALTPPRLDGGQLVTDVLSPGDPGPTQVVAFGRTEDGTERRIAVAEAATEDGKTTATFDLPPQLQSTVTRIVLADQPSAGGAAFADGSIRRVSAGLVANEGDSTVTTLTSATHYIEKALVPWADLKRGVLAETVEAAPAAIILSDHADMPDEERTALTEWVEAGGLLIRFAGPRLAASIGAQGFGSVQANDPLLPVRLRRGGRVLGGALAWTTPRALGPFARNSPFRGLTPPEEVDVRTQVLAEPSPDLAGKVWASLDDGTPLVTAKRLGDGQIVLFHVSADAEWSSLPLSGLFVEMLGRLMSLAPGRSAGVPDAEQMIDTIWRPDLLMGADGTPQPAPAAADSATGEAIIAGDVGPSLPPGVYIRASQGDRNSNQAESIVINLTQAETTLTAFPDPPAAAVQETLGGTAPERYGPWLLAMAILLIIADIVGSLYVSGRFGSGMKAAAMVLVGVLALPAHEAVAQDQEITAGELEATAETTLGYVLTGDSRIDRVSERGMEGLRLAMARRTAVEPGPSVGVDPETDVLAFFPVLYLPLVADALPSRAGLEALAGYLQTGGMLIIDTQNGSSGFGGASAVQMREIARALNLPPLAPVDEDHVLSRTFYLLSAFPGRWRGGRIWTEAAPPRPDGVPDDADIPRFDRIDDDVSPVIVGSADWASAWAVDTMGMPMFPIGRPGDRQREMAVRFGVNAVMYALTGNYKSDQVHAPAVLKRLGQ
ncbi:MAG: DUF4159 domain-containing protein [Pseudomonadota bacterium]